MLVSLDNQNSMELHRYIGIVGTSNSLKLTFLPLEGVLLLFSDLERRKLEGSRLILDSTDCRRHACSLTSDFRKLGLVTAADDKVKK